MKRLGVKLTGVIGLAVAASGIVWMGATLEVGGSYWNMFGGMIAMAIGLGWTFVPFTLIATTNVHDDEAGLASGIFNTSQQIGGAIGLAVLTTIFVNTRDGELSDIGVDPVPLQGFSQLKPEEIGVQLTALVEGYQTAFYAGAALMALALVLHLLLIRRSDVASIDVTAPATPHVG